MRRMLRYGTAGGRSEREAGGVTIWRETRNKKIFWREKIQDSQSNKEHKDARHLITPRPYNQNQPTHNAHQIILLCTIKTFHVNPNSAIATPRNLFARFSFHKLEIFVPAPPPTQPCPLLMKSPPISRLFTPRRTADPS